MKIEAVKMNIEIHARRVPLSRKLRKSTERRIRSALTRFDERITRVSLWLSDVNGPKGGNDKNCQVQIVMSGKPDVVIEETRENLYLAINRAIERAGQTVVRKLDRQRSRVKRSGQLLPIPVSTV
jgi:putative sigma-54 modulation protein